MFKCKLLRNSEFFWELILKNSEFWVGENSEPTKTNMVDNNTQPVGINGCIKNNTKCWEMHYNLSG